jgi:chaperonin cofactor prefoldin
MSKAIITINIDYLNELLNLKITDLKNKEQSYQQRFDDVEKEYNALAFTNKWKQENFVPLMNETDSLYRQIRQLNAARKEYEIAYKVIQELDYAPPRK